MYSYITLSAEHFVMFYVHCSMLILSLILYESSCSIIKPWCSRFTVDSQLEKFRWSRFTVAFRRPIFYISHYRRKYPSRRISYALNGSFNPYIITNKEAHMANGNPAVSKDSNCHKSSQTLKPQLQKCFSKEVSEPLCRSDLPAL